MRRRYNVYNNMKVIKGTRTKGRHGIKIPVGPEELL
jgi:hypothetical protein